MKIFQKIIATILIIAMISTLAWNIFLYKPKQVKALDAGGSWATFTQALLHAIKEFALDAIAKTVAGHMMDKMRMDLIRWAQGGFSDENKPFAMMDWGEELLDSLNVAVADFIQKKDLTGLCTPLGPFIEFDLQLIQYPHTLPSYMQYGACTLDRIIANLERFWDNPSLLISLSSSRRRSPDTTLNERWRAWIYTTAIARHNVHGMTVISALEKNAGVGIQEKKKEMEIITNKGYLNEGVCNKSEGQECNKLCRAGYPEEISVPGPPPLFIPIMMPNPALVNCLRNCEIKASMGICINRKVTKLGSTIGGAVGDLIPKEMEWLISADEITELIGIFFSALVNKAIHGISGLVANPSYTYQTADYKDRYSYYQSSRRTSTPELREDLRSQIVSSIAKNLGGLTRRTVQCAESQSDAKKKQMRIEQLAEALPEMLEGEVQHLYTGIMMVDLKPDYKVLDPPRAPFRVYGSTWDEIPFEQYPPRCAKLTKEFGNNLTCKEIVIDLPYGLDISNINSICTATCLNAINKYRQECATTRNGCLAACRWDPQPDVCEISCHDEYDVCEDNAISQAISDGKCSGPPAPGNSDGGGGGGGGGGGDIEDPEPPYMHSLYKDLIPFEDIFKTGKGSEPVILAQVAICGDGLLDLWAGEECDDGNTDNGDGCDENCQLECGNGSLDPGEQCDDGNTDNGDGCDENCQLEAGVCGDGNLDPGEECDDNNLVNGDGCSSTCTIEGPAGVCGDGNLDPGEECDDNNLVNGDGCSSTCTIEAAGVCGDGVVAPDEQCDDNNTVNGDGCDENCNFEVPPEPDPGVEFPAVRECLDGALLIQKTEDRCRECLEKAQKGCEAETDPALEDACIQEVCNNYEGIEGGGMSPITDGLDFYQRCTAVEKKYACEVCLKEYFVPATYCQQILDYMSRAFVKYPAVVYIEDIEQSWLVKILKWVFPIWGLFEWIFGGAPKPGNWWIGWYDEDSGCKNNKDSPKDKISVGLICRGFEEFEYKGSNICQTACRATTEERRDVLDFEPTNADCGNRKIGEALPPASIITAAVFKARTKCCAALVTDRDAYRACVFGEKITETGPSAPISDTFICGDHDYTPDNDILCFISDTCCEAEFSGDPPAYVCCEAGCVNPADPGDPDPGTDGCAPLPI